MSSVSTVHAAFADSAQRYAAQAFLHIVTDTAAAYGIAPGDLAYGEAAIRVEALADRYAGAGYGHGHRVGLLLENRPEFFLHWLALNRLGVSVVPINADLRSAELEYLIGHSGMLLAVTLPGRAENLMAAARAAGRAGFGTVAPEALDALPTAAEPPPRQDAPSEASECALLYTSGTTGRPKGCILPNEYFLAAGRWYAGIGGLCTLQPGRERLITPLPMVHMNAMAYSPMAMILTGGTSIPLDRFHPNSWWRSVRESQATVVHYLGVMPAMLMAAPATPDDRNHAVRFGFGAGVPAQHHDAFEQRFGFPLLEAWAMTETGAGAVIIANHEPRKTGTACFGRALPGVEWRVVDEAGADAGTDQPGELLVRHHGADPTFGFFKGYLKDAEATAEAWAGGWFHTGDVVRVDADGDFHFVDRKKNVIRRSGENIAAVEVEGVLLQHPAVKAAGVAAVPDAVRGDEVMACIVLRDDQESTPAARQAVAESLVDWCLERLAYYKAPGYVAFAPGLPLTATNKIQRADLRQLAHGLLGGDACVDTRALKKRRG